MNRIKVCYCDKLEKYQCCKVCDKKGMCNLVCEVNKEECIAYKQLVQKI